MTAQIDALNVSPPSSSVVYFCFSVGIALVLSELPYVPTRLRGIANAVTYALAVVCVPVALFVLVMVVPRLLG